MDRIFVGSHPNRPLPTTEVRMAVDAEILQCNPELLAAAAEGVNDVIRLMGHSAVFSNDLVNQATALSDMEQHFLNEQGQVKSTELLWHIKDAAAADKPLFALVNKDLVAPGTNFIFGLTAKEWYTSIQSAFRFTEAIKDATLLSLVFRHIARHEYAHLVGLDESSIRNQDPRGARQSLFRGHCANECTMHQVLSVGETLQLAQKLMGRPHAGFCADCTGFLRSHR